MRNVQELRELEVRIDRLYEDNMGMQDDVLRLLAQIQGNVAVMRALARQVINQAAEQQEEVVA